MINYSSVYLPKKEEYINYINKIYKSGWVTNNGNLKNELEYKLKKFLKIKNIILVSSGSMALQLAYKALNLNGNVITTPFTYIATVSTLIWENLEPNFVDIDPKTLNIDTNLIEKKINNRTSAILPVHVFGNPCEVELIKKIAKKNNLKIIYDASHAFNTNYKNKSVLNFGDISIVSLHATKIFHTVEGGAIITNDDSLAKKIRMLSNFGKNKESKIKNVGINAKMNEFEAAMGLCLLKNFNEISKVRKKIWYSYYYKLKKYLIFQDFSLFSNPNYSYFPIIFDSEKQLKLTVNFLKKNKILVKRYFYPSLDSLNLFQQYGKCPASVDISKRILCLPIYFELDELKQKKIVNLIIKSLKETF